MAECDRSSISVVDDEHVLRVEAEGAVKEIAFAVKYVEIAKSLPFTSSVVYLNLMTKENESVCVELSVQGFRIIGKQFDLVDESNASPFYETIYALLDNLSPGYRNTFSDTLIMRLQQLQSDDQGETSTQSN